MEHDDAGRVVRTASASDEGIDDDPANFNDDTVLTETVLEYDDGGAPIATTTYDRRHDAGGHLGLLSGDPSKARVTHTATWHDRAHRPTHVVAYGTNAPDDPATDPAPEPDTSDDYIVTKSVYDLAGRPLERVDNAGIVTRFEYDALGRVTKQIEHYTDGTPTDDSNRTTQFVYHASGQVAEQIAVMPQGADDQTTTYVYGGDDGSASPVARRDLLVRTIYPLNTAILLTYSARHPDSYLTPRAGAAASPATPARRCGSSAGRPGSRR